MKNTNNERKKLLKLSLFNTGLIICAIIAITVSILLFGTNPAINIGGPSILLTTILFILLYKFPHITIIAMIFAWLLHMLKQNKAAKYLSYIPLLNILTIIALSIIVFISTMLNTNEIAQFKPITKTAEPISIETEVELPTYGPRTTKEYLEDIPDKYFMGITAKERIESITSLDEENYYTAFNPLNLDGDGSMAIFIKPDEGYIIATEIKGCGPACHQEFYLLEVWAEGYSAPTQYRDVTEELLPALDFSEQMKIAKEKNPNTPFIPLITLPQHGTTIEIREQFSNEILATLKWKDGKFIKTP